MQLLLLKDELDLQKTLKKGLMMSGYQVETTHDGAHALDLVLSHSYDLVILDLNLPTMDGMEVLSVLREALIGQTIEFQSMVGNWDSGSYQTQEIKIQVNIVGVMDASLFFENGDSTFTFDVENSFIFSQDILEAILQQANTSMDSTSITMRASSAENLIAIRDELLQVGIIPNGHFELVEDFVKLGSQTQHNQKVPTA